MLVRVLKAFEDDLMDLIVSKSYELLNAKWHRG